MNEEAPYRSNLTPQEIDEAFNADAAKLTTTLIDDQDEQPVEPIRPTASLYRLRWESEEIWIVADSFADAIAAWRHRYPEELEVRTDPDSLERVDDMGVVVRAIQSDEVDRYIGSLDCSGWPGHMDRQIEQAIHDFATHLRRRLNYPFEDDR